MRAGGSDLWFGDRKRYNTDSGLVEEIVLISDSCADPAVPLPCADAARKGKDISLRRCD
jgi:hypothetical protein